MSEKKEKGLNYYRQSKGYGYTPPLSHPVKDKRNYNFTQKELIEYIIKCMSTIKTLSFKGEVLKNFILF